MRLQGKFEIRHSSEWKGQEQAHEWPFLRSVRYSWNSVFSSRCFLYFSYLLRRTFSLLWSSSPDKLERRRPNKREAQKGSLSKAWWDQVVVVWMDNPCVQRPGEWMSCSSNAPETFFYRINGLKESSRTRGHVLRQYVGSKCGITWGGKVNLSPSLSPSLLASPLLPPPPPPHPTPHPSPCPSPTHPYTRATLCSFVVRPVHARIRDSSGS